MNNCKVAETILITGLILLNFPGRASLSAEILSPGNQNSVITIGHEEGAIPGVRKVAGVEMVLITGNGLMPFWISRYEVTQCIYESVTGKNPSYFKGRNLPVEQVSWFDAVEFCNMLSLKAGLNPCYRIDKNKRDPENMNSGIRWTVTINSDADGFRIPTSLEWETAARGGSRSRYFWGEEMNGEYCWYADNSHETTHPVGEKKPNDRGIFDICGNVREWCFDWHPLYHGYCRVLRDGHYSLDAEEMQIDKEDYRSPHFEFGFTGIRLVRNY